MSDLKSIFEKIGGYKTISNYAKAGVLPYMIGQILLTGKSITSLEIIRNGLQLKIKQKLMKRYSSVLKKFNTKYDETNYPRSRGNKVWVCWMQGMENAPKLVQRCYRSLQENIPNKEIVLLTEENISQYVKIPEFIMEKYHKGIITKTHFSDILRVELLIQNGGTWIDATVLCTGNVPDYMLEDDFFLFQKIKPGSDGSTINMSSWFMTSCSNNKILLATRELLYAYWRENNRLIDYFLLHLFMMIVKDFYKEEWGKISPYPNSLPHIIQLMQFEQFDQRKWDMACMLTPFHKLTYKIKEKETGDIGTFYNYIMKR